MESRQDRPSRGPVRRRRPGDHGLPPRRADRRGGLGDRGASAGRSAFVFPSFRAHSPFRFPLGFSIAVRRRLDAFSDLRARSIDFFKPDEPMAHDQWFSSLAFMLGRVVYLDEELVAYRQHSGALFGAGDGVLAPPETRTLGGWFTAESDYRPLPSTLQALADCGAEVAARLPLDESGERERRHLDIARAELARLIELYQLRARVYSDRSLPSRALAWSRLLREAAYAAGPRWRFHRKFLLRDLLAGVLAATAMKPVVKPLTKTKKAINDRSGSCGPMAVMLTPSNRFVFSAGLMAREPFGASYNIAFNRDCVKTDENFCHAEATKHLNVSKRASEETLRCFVPQHDKLSLIHSLLLYDKAVFNCLTCRTHDLLICPTRAVSDTIRVGRAVRRLGKYAYVKKASSG